MRAAPSAARLTFAMCAAEVLGMLAFATYSAQLIGFVDEWHLTFTEAGWIGGVFSLGNVLAIPVLVTLTDKVEARTVYLWSTALMGCANLGFGLFAEGFWTGMFFRGLAGVGFAGAQLPGLRLLTDRIPPGPDQTRAVTVYSASMALGGAVSYLIAGWVLPRQGWPFAFCLGAVGCALAIAVVLLNVPGQQKVGVVKGLPDFRPVLRNRAVMVWILANTGHQFENYAIRAWSVGFLLFAAERQGVHALPLGLTAATLMGITVLFGFVGNFAGGAVGKVLGRRRAVLLTGAMMMIVATLLGLSPNWAFGLAFAFLLLHSAGVSMDNPLINGGAIEAAPPEQRGAAMALFGMVGFVGAMLGPAAFGFTLDLFGRGSPTGWFTALVLLAVVALAGMIGLLRYRPAKG
jgi:MFS family permease